MDYADLLSRFRSRIGEIQFSYLNVLNVGWEGGTVCLKNPAGEKLTLDISRAGGMAVVVGELPKALVRYGKESGMKVRICSVCPYISGAMRDSSLSSLVKLGYMKKVMDVTTSYSGKKYEVEVYEGETDFGRQYLLKSIAWAGKFGGSMSPYILTLEGNEERSILEQGFASNSPYAMNLMEERAYIVFAQAAAKLYDHTKANAAILHDYHSALSVFYNDEVNPVIVGHNMAYQGIMAVNENKLKLLIKHGVPDTPREIASKDVRKAEQDHRAATSDIAVRLDLPEDIIERYFRCWVRKDDVGAGNILQAVIRRSREMTGISATTVSPGYVSELKETIDDIKQKIAETYSSELPPNHFSVSSTRKRIKDFYLSHFDISVSDAEADRFQLTEESRGLEELRLGNVVGILNGLGAEKHASKNQVLRDIVLDPYKFEWRNIHTPAYLKNVVARTPYFSKGLNYDASDPDRVFKCKKILRRILLMEFFPDKKDSAIWDDEESFIHYSWGRLVDQKNIPLIIAEAENLTKQGNILILIAANPDDALSMEIEHFSALRSEAMRKSGLRFAFSSKFDNKGSIYAGGADLVHVPSRYEPCGLTDMESYWMGTPVVAHMVGGLGKGGYAVAGFKADPTSLDAMCLAYRDVYNRAVNIKKYYPEQWKELCIEALNLDFSYQKTANDYIDVMYLAMTKRTVDIAVRIAEAYDAGVVDQQIIDELLVIISRLPERFRKVYWEAYNLFPDTYGKRSFFVGAKPDTIRLLFGS
jgi:glycogen synthase